MKSEYYQGGFFWAAELSGLPVETPIGPFLEAMGYDFDIVYLGHLIEDQNNYDHGGQYAADEIAKMRIVKKYPATGLELMAVYDTEDGPFALYCKPVAGLALSFQIQREKIAEMGQRIAQAEKGLAVAIDEINGIIAGEWGKENWCKWDDFMPGGNLLENYESRKKKKRIGLVAL